MSLGKVETSKIRLHSIGARSLVYQDIRPGLAKQFDLSDDDTLLPASELTNKKQVRQPIKLGWISHQGIGCCLRQSFI